MYLFSEYASDRRTYSGALRPLISRQPLLGRRRSDRS